MGKIGITSDSRFLVLMNGLKKRSKMATSQNQLKNHPEKGEKIDGQMACRKCKCITSAKICPAFLTWNGLFLSNLAVFAHCELTLGSTCNTRTSLKGKPLRRFLAEFACERNLTAPFSWIHFLKYFSTKKRLQHMMRPCPHQSSHHGLHGCMPKRDMIFAKP